MKENQIYCGFKALKGEFLFKFFISGILLIVELFFKYFKRKISGFQESLISLSNKF